MIAGIIPPHPVPHLLPAQTAVPSASARLQSREDSDRTPDWISWITTVQEILRIILKNTLSIEFVLKKTHNWL
jgi:hypothetical protein